MPAVLLLETVLIYSLSFTPDTSVVTVVVAIVIVIAAAWPQRPLARHLAFLGGQLEREKPAGKKKVGFLLQTFVSARGSLFHPDVKPGVPGAAFGKGTVANGRK